MEKVGDQDDCVSTTEANELAAKLDEDQKSTLPLPGQVDFINGGPPCQVCILDCCNICVNFLLNK